MPKFKDITGQVFGRLSVQRFVRMEIKESYQYSVWECKCDCGTTIEARGSTLTQGAAISCGCARPDLAVRGWNKRGRKHSASEHPLYNTWLAMVARCSKPHLDTYRLYGARGIKVCDEWKNDANTFICHMLAIGWRPGLTVDRIDTNGNYEPGNVRAADDITQANNTRRNRVIEFNGERMTMAEWARKVGIPYGRLQMRIQRGWDAARALAN